LNDKDISTCAECGEEFEEVFYLDLYCSEECEKMNENEGWRNSNYESKSIEDWDVDDHLASWYDHMMEK
jgi:hypothetical protein